MIFLCGGLPESNNPYNRVTPSALTVLFVDDQPITALLRGERTGILRALHHHVDAQNSRLHAFGRKRLQRALKPKRIRHAPTVNCDGATPDVAQDAMDKGSQGKLYPQR